MIEFVFDANFVFVWVKSLKKVHSQLCSILLGLGQLSSHMCVRQLYFYFQLQNGSNGGGIPMEELQRQQGLDVEGTTNINEPPQPTVKELEYGPLEKPRKGKL